MAGERTEQASPRRKQKAREQGDRARSRDLVAACATLAGALTLGMLASHWVASWAMAYQQFLALSTGRIWEQGGGVAVMLKLRLIAIEALWPVCAIFAASAGGALLSGIGQGGGVSFHAEALRLKLTRIDPFTNLKNIFSLRAPTRLAKTMFPALLLAAIAWGKLNHQANLPAMSVARMPRMFADGYDLLIDAAWILFAWSAIDYAVEWRSWNQRLRMSKQELREEFRDQEGNPQVRGRIRNIQRQMRRRQMKADVSRASVVITNPTHYAVALGFDFDTMDAPKVLAKGRNILAEQIKAEARWAGVPIVENPPLARSLHKLVEPGQSIPFELYAAVAGILAYLYRRQVEERASRQRQEAAAKAEKSETPGAGTPEPGMREEENRSDNRNEEIS